MDKIYIGAAHYPELWDESEVDRDILRCKDLGINALRVGEFAWSKMEPREGVFNFVWLENIVDKLYENGIYTVMCTPTCTPPRWMLNKYSQTRRVDSRSKRVEVSSRCHTCKTSPVMREKNRLIVEEMAKTFAGKAGIIGWQIDNEIFPYDDGCYCDDCKRAFREYLKDRYVSIETLNKSWGMYRWSLDYSTFDEIEPPYPDEWRHPSLRKAWWNFQCRQINEYIDEQAEILHRYGYKNVGTDMMPFDSLDYIRTNEKLDTVMFNHYDSADELIDTSFTYDFARCVKDKPFWITETQTGWNGSEFAANGFRPVGNCYANTWLPVSRGAEMNLYWLFRAHPGGHELAHGALYSTAGREYRVTGEVRQACRDIDKCLDFLSNSKVKSKIALHYSSAAEIDFNYCPYVEGFDYRNTLIKDIYSAFRHCNIDVIDPTHSLNSFDVVISPFLAETDIADFRERIVKWIENGGTWIVGPLSDIYDGNLRKYTSSPFGFIEELAGVYTKYQKPLDNREFKAKWQSGEECGVSLYYDAFEISGDTLSLADYCQGEFSGLSAVAERRIGKGKIIIVGSKLGSKDWLRLTGVNAVTQASDNVILTERRGKQNGIIAVETQNKAGYVVLDGQYVDLITDTKLSGRIVINPYEVKVLKDCKH